MTIRELQQRALAIAIEKGFYDRDRSVPEALALVHSEISEALECYRDGVPIGATWLHNGKPEGFAVELADAVIRIADLAGHLGLDLETAIEEKLRYNTGRPYRHGGKKC